MAQLTRILKSQVDRFARVERLVYGKDQVLSALTVRAYLGNQVGLVGVVLNVSAVLVLIVAVLVVVVDHFAVEENSFNHFKHFGH